MATKGTTKVNKPVAPATPQAPATPEANAQAVHLETLPSILNADGTSNPNLVNQVRNQYDRICLVHPDGREIVIQTTEEGTKPTKISKALWYSVIGLVLAGFSGRSMSTDGAIEWLSRAEIQSSKNLQTLVQGGWMVQLHPSGQGGAFRYDVEASMLNRIGLARAEFVVPSIEKYPAKRSTRGAPERKQEEVDFFLG